MGKRFAYPQKLLPFAMSLVLGLSIVGGGVPVRAEANPGEDSTGLPVVVDYSTDLGPVEYTASGFLHPMDYKTPAEWLSDGVYVESIRGQAHHNEFNSHYEYLPGYFDDPTYERLMTHNPEAVMMIGLYYEFKGNHGSAWMDKAIENNGQIWKDHIKELMSEAYDEQGNPTREVYSWIPWNEPNLQWGSRFNTDFRKAFQYAYEGAKAVDPSVRVQGPEIHAYNFSQLTGFLTYCKANNCLPDVLSWHELKKERVDIEANVKEIRNWMIFNGIAPMPIAITEYQGTGANAANPPSVIKSNGYYNTGLAVSFISSMERASVYGLDFGLRAEWSIGGGDPSMKPNLSGLADYKNTNMPTGLWYVYNAYRDMTGRKVQTTHNVLQLEAIAATDGSVDRKTSTILIGNWAEDNKKAALSLKNVPDYLKANGKVHVKVDHIEETLSTASYGTDVWLDQDVAVNDDGSINLGIDVLGRSAVKIVVTPPTGDAVIYKVEELTPVVSGSITSETVEGVVYHSNGQPSSYVNPESVYPSNVTYKETGDKVGYSLSVPEDGLYNFKSVHKTGPDNGFMQLYVNGKLAGLPADLYSAEAADKEMNYGNLYLKAGANNFEFRIVGTGKNELSTGYTLTFEQFSIAPVSQTDADLMVTFNANHADGKVSQTTMTVARNQKLASLPVATRAGYTFNGWNTDPDGNGAILAADLPIAADTVAYAQWLVNGEFNLAVAVPTNLAVPVQATLDKATANDGEVVTLTLSSDFENVGYMVKTSDGQDLTSTIVNNQLEYTVDSSVTFLVTAIPGAKPPVERNGIVHIEAEIAQLNSSFAYIVGNGTHTWAVVDGQFNQGLQFFPDSGFQVNGTDSASLATSAKLGYSIEFSTPGKYYVWALAKAPGASGDSIHVGLDNVFAFTQTNIKNTNNWIWNNLGSIDISEGLHELNFWGREDGLAIDRIYLTTSELSSDPVWPINIAPEAMDPVPAQQVHADSTASFTASDIATDQNDDPLAIMEIVNGPDSSIATAALNNGTVTLTGQSKGTTSMTVRVSDGDASVVITVPIAVAEGLIKLTVPNVVFAGELFTSVYGLNHVPGTILGQDITFTFDPNVVEFISVESEFDEFQVIEKDVGTNTVRLIAVHINEEQEANGSYLNVQWRLKPGAAGTTAIALSVVVANDEGEETQLPVISREIPISSVDRQALLALIDSAQEKHDAASEGTAVGQYQVGSKANLQTAINQAIVAANNSEISQDQIDEAAAALNNALRAFEALKVVSRPGDINYDNRFTIGDLALIAKFYGKTSEDPDWQSIKVTDVVADGIIDLQDLVFVARLILLP